MSKRKLVAGAKVTIYRIPKNCFYWCSPEMDKLLRTEQIIEGEDLQDSVILIDSFIVPKSCLKAI